MEEYRAQLDKLQRAKNDEGFKRPTAPILGAPITDRDAYWHNVEFKVGRVAINMEKSKVREPFLLAGAPPWLVRSAGCSPPGTACVLQLLQQELEDCINKSPNIAWVKCREVSRPTWAICAAGTLLNHHA